MPADPGASRARGSGGSSLSRSPWGPALATLFLLLYAYLAYRDPAVGINDFFGFVLLAEGLSSADPKSLANGFYPLGYPTALRALFAAAGDYLVAGKALSVAAGALATYLTYRLSLAFTTDNRAALLAQALVGANPTFLRWATAESTDMPWTALQLATICLLTRQASRPSHPLLGGLLAGLSYLFRYTSLALLPVYCLWLILAGRVRPGLLNDPQKVLRLSGGPSVSLDHHGKSPGKSARFAWGYLAAGLFAAGFLAAASPQLAASASATGNPFYNTQAKNVWFGVYGEGNWELNWRKAPDTISLGEVFLQDPERFVRHWAEELGSFFQRQPLVFPLDLLAYGGFLAALLGRQRRQALLLLSLLVALVTTTAAAFLETRLLLLTLPLLLAPALGAAGLGLRALPPWGGRLALALLGGLLVYWGYLALTEAGERAHSHQVYLQASEALHRDGMASSREVLSSSHSFYDAASPYKTRFATLFWDARRPIRDLEDLRAELEEGGYRYLLYEENYGGRSFPQLRFLLEPEKSPFRPIFSHSEKPTVVIYRVAEVSPK